MGGRDFQVWCSPGRETRGRETASSPCPETSVPLVLLNARRKSPKKVSLKLEEYLF